MKKKIKKRIKEKLMWINYKLYVNGLTDHETYININSRLWWW